MPSLDPVVIPEELADDLGLGTPGLEGVLPQGLLDLPVEEEGLPHQQAVGGDGGLSASGAAGMLSVSESPSFRFGAMPSVYRS